MGRETGKRGLHAFVDWVENGGEPDESLNGDLDESLNRELAAEKLAQAHVMGTEELGTKDLGTAYLGREVQALKIFGSVYRMVAQTVCLAGMAVLLMMVSHLPAFGAADNPANNEVVSRYLEQGLEETGAVNTVAGIILDYRAFDTFGESVVLFLAAASVVALMRRRNPAEKHGHGRKDCPAGEPSYGREDWLVGEHSRPGGRMQKKEERHEEDIILEEVSRLLVPFILMFGIYVVLNGHLSPGGGFSGGTVMGAGLILYANAFGYGRIHRFFSFRTFTLIISSALMVYALSKGYSFFMGANHLESGIPLGTPGNILSAGLILPLDICVGLVVAGTMYCFYSLFREGEV